MKFQQTPRHTGEILPMDAINSHLSCKNAP